MGAIWEYHNWKWFFWIFGGHEFRWDQDSHRYTFVYFYSSAKISYKVKNKRIILIRKLIINQSRRISLRDEEFPENSLTKKIISHTIVVLR